MNQTTKRTVSIGLIVAVASLLAVLSGCTNGIPGLTEGYGAVTLDVQATAPATGAPLAAIVGARAAGDPLVVPVTNADGTEAGTLTLTDARVVLKQIQISQDEGEVDTDEEAAQAAEVEFEGPYVVDLVQNTSTPELPQIEMLPGNYNNIELDLDKIEGDEEDGAGTQLVADTDPLFGNSIYLAGTYTGTTLGGSVTDAPFTMTFDLDEEFELSSAGSTATGLVVEDGQFNPIIIAFRLVRWFAFNDPETNSGLVTDFRALATVAGPAIVIDETATGDNSTIREIIKANIEQSADYGEDEDGSGNLESDEDDDPDEEDTNDD